MLGDIHSTVAESHPLDSAGKDRVFSDIFITVYAAVVLETESITN